MHRNRNPCNSFLMAKMASGMDNERKAALGQWSTSRKHAALMSSKPEPAIWLRDSGQSADQCHVTISRAQV